jgi:hypothetical protein
MVELLLAPLVVFLALAGWVGVQQLYARFQARYPQLGPFRDSGGGCSCGKGHCSSKNAC